MKSNSEDSHSPQSRAVPSLGSDNRKILRKTRSDANMDDSIKVICRFRPLRAPGPDQSTSCVECFNLDEQAVEYVGYDGYCEKQFAFDKVFSPDSTQDSIFNEVSGVVGSVVSRHTLSSSITFQYKQRHQSTFIDERIQWNYYGVWANKCRKIMDDGWAGGSSYILYSSNTYTPLALLLYLLHFLPPIGALE